MFKKFEKFEILNPQTLMGGNSTIGGDVEIESEVSQGGTVNPS